ncbi:hypothetical protein GCM10008927_23670 [Amylibacter ulvae]|uniref:YeeE/YedE family protein n=1 Tax=Paramylibacter ulvae TaxID=1651968 RepID=A0ABQ3D526_9RHOB|nr:DUF6691 family protein [Amylibacter ulvae]GHA57264.1 hypothetical protein GCM10008927_23670 [Amylibacter ulvae]
MKNISYIIIGMIFGLGISISGMINPAKVLNFFDIAGFWDPSLMFVMGGALITTMIGYRIVFGRHHPIFATKFSIPTRNEIDTQLIGGAAVFGIGWGIAGFCPGASIPAIGSFKSEVLIFTVAMTAGILVARAFKNGVLSKAKA